MGGVYFAYMGRRNPLTDWAQFFLGERYPSRNQAHQIWWRSLKGFRGSCGSNFSISHWLCWSSLQHSHTTVWACDATLTSLDLNFVFFLFYVYFDHVCCHYGDNRPILDKVFTNRPDWFFVTVSKSLLESVLVSGNSPCVKSKAKPVKRKVSSCSRRSYNVRVRRCSDLNSPTAAAGVPTPTRPGTPLLQRRELAPGA